MIRKFVEKKNYEYLLILEADIKLANIKGKKKIKVPQMN